MKITSEKWVSLEQGLFKEVARNTRTMIIMMHHARARVLDAYVQTMWPGKKLEYEMIDYARYTLSSPDLSHDELMEVQRYLIQVEADIDDPFAAMNDGNASSPITGSDGLYVWNVYYENADTDEPRAWIGTIGATTGGQALEHAESAYKRPSHDLVVIRQDLDKKR